LWGFWMYPATVGRSTGAKGPNKSKHHKAQKLLLHFLTSFIMKAGVFFPEVVAANLFLPQRLAGL
jgi:hypothetical protein